MHFVVITANGKEKVDIVVPGTLTVGALRVGTADAEYTISSGVITIGAVSFCLVDTEGDASTDDLDTISGGGDCQLLILRAASSARDVVVKSGTGNIYLAGGADFTMDNTADRLLLLYRGTWTELSRSNNA